MAGKYISTNMETGLEVKEALEKIESYNPDTYAWTEIVDSTIDLKNPTSNPNITDPGDYVIYNYTNGPSDVDGTISPILLSIRDGNKCITANGTSYIYSSDVGYWQSVEETKGTDVTLWVKSDTAPERTENTFWFDTSKKDDATDPYVDLKYYDTNTNTWTSVFSSDNYLKKSEIDPEGKETDIYQYVMDELTKLVGDYSEFIKHINNQLTLVHVDGTDREKYAKLMSESDLQDLITNTYTSALTQVISDSVDAELPVNSSETVVGELESTLETHKEGHVTSDQITSWTNKAEANHTHDYTTGDTKIDGSQIVTGTITADKLPDEVKERFYEMTYASAEEEFNRSSITDSDRTSKYHNGNTFYLSTTDDSGDTSYSWYKIIDQTKIGTSEWADGVVDITASVTSLSWENITGAPTSLEEFGITNDLYTKEDIDEKLSQYQTSASDIDTALDNLDNIANSGNTAKYVFTGEIESIGIQEVTTTPSKFTDTATGTIPHVDIIVKTKDGKIYKTTVNSNSTYNFNDESKTTENAAEHIGTGFTETQSDAHERYYCDNSYYNQVEYDSASGYFYAASSVKGNPLKKSKDGISWVNVSDEILTTGFLYHPSAKIFYITNISDTQTKIYELVDGQIGTNSLDAPYNTQIAADPLYGTDNGIYQYTGYSELPFEVNYEIVDYTPIGLFEFNLNDGSASYIHMYKTGNDYKIDIAPYSTKEFSTVSTNEFSSTNRFYKVDEYNYIQFSKEKCVLITVDANDNFEIKEVIIKVDGNYIEPTSLEYTALRATTDKMNITYYDYTNKTYSIAKANLTTTSNIINFNSMVLLEDSGVTPLDVDFNDEYCVIVGKNGGGVISKDIFRKASYKWTISDSGNLNSDKELPKIETYDLTSTDSIKVNCETNYTKNMRDSHEGYSYVFSGWSPSYYNITKNSLVYQEFTGKWTKTTSLTYEYEWDANEIGVPNVTLPNSGTQTYNNTVSVDKKYSNKSIVNNVWIENTISDASRNWRSVCYGNGKFVAIAYNSIYSVCLIDTINVDTDGITWVENTISSTSRYWISVCYGNGKYVAIAYNSTISAYSTDGINWIENTISSTSRQWYSICYGNGKYVAIATNSTISAYSTDGINWIENTISSTSRQWYSICYGNGKYVAIATNSTISAYSTDGINWIENTISDTSRYWRSVCYGNGKYVAIAYSSKYSAYSTDGINWIENTISSTSRQWYSICYGNGKYVAVAYGTYSAYSTDGINWIETTISSTKRQWSSVCYGNGKYVAVAYNSTISAILNGTSYYQFSGWDHSDFIITKDTIISGTWAQKDKLKVSYSWTNAPDTLIAEVPDNCYFIENTTAIVDKEYDNNCIHIKEDTLIWIENTISDTKRNWYSVCYGNGKYVAVVYNSTISAYSTDGINWVENTISDTSREWYSVCYGNGKYVAVAYESTYSAYSTDGINWIENTISDTSRYWRSVCYGNGKYVAIAWYDTYSAYSTDGINWIENTISDTKRYWSSVCYGNGKYVAVANSTNISAYSTDGITWIETNISDTSRNWYSVCYGNGKYVAVAYNSTYSAYSTDGINWIETTISDTSRKWQSICYGNDKYVAIAYNSKYYAYSTDGITWIETTISDTKRYWYSVCYGNGKYVAVAYNDNYSAILQTTDAYYQFSGWDKTEDFTITTDTNITGNWTLVDNIPMGSWIENTISDTSSDTSRNWQSICYGNGKYVAVAYNSKYSAYSTDGITWVETTISDTSRQWYSVCYGNGKYVAIATNSTYSAYSTDGINWIENNISGTSRYWISVCYGNGKYVAIAYNDDYYAYSTDGITWVENTISDTIRYWWSVCYGNGKFVAVAYNDNYYAYSTDGINWIETTISDTTRDWWSVCYGNGKYVAIAYDTIYYAYSTDGINWIENTISDTGRGWRSVCYGNGKYVAIADSSTYYAYSTDGINWIENTISDTSRGWYSVCYGNGKYVAIANNSTYSAYSTDGINWIETTISDTSRGWYSVCYGNGKYVAVADDSTNISAYSTDGINWIENTISDTGRGWRSVCYGNGKYVAVAYDSTYYAYLLDTNKLIK